MKRTISVFLTLAFIFANVAGALPIMSSFEETEKADDSYIVGKTADPAELYADEMKVIEFTSDDRGGYSSTGDDSFESVGGFKLNFNDADDPRDSLTIANNSAENDKQFYGPSTTGITADLYDYFVIKMKNTGSKDAILRIYWTSDGCPKWFTETDAWSISIPASQTEYKYYVQYIPEGAFSSDSDKPFSGKNLKLLYRMKNAGTSVEIDSIGFYKNLNFGSVEIFSDSSYVSKPGREINLSAQFTSDLDISDGSVTWSVSGNSELASVRTLSDGTAVLTSGVGLGDVTVTAVSSSDKSINSSKKIRIDVDKDNYPAYYSSDALTANGNHSITETNADKGTKTFSHNNGSSDGYIGVNGFESTDKRYIVAAAKNVSEDAYSGRLYWITETQNCFCEDQSVPYSFAKTDDGMYYGVADVLSSNVQPKGNIEAIRLTVGGLDESDFAEMFGMFCADSFDANEKWNIEPETHIFLKASSDKITADSGTVTLTAAVQSSPAVTKAGAEYSFSGANVRIDKNDDGTVTLTAIENGTVTVTATCPYYPEVSDSVTITVTGQREKIAAYSLNYFALGNSFLFHGIFPYNSSEGYVDGEYVGWGDTNQNRGMASSSIDKDYFHRIQAILKEKLICSVTADGRGSADVERVISSSEVTQNDLINSKPYAEIKETIESRKPNFITFQLGQNIQIQDSDTLEMFYDTMFGMINQVKPEKSVVVVISQLSPGVKSKAEKKYAQKYGFGFADMTYISSYGSGRENPYLAYQQYPQYDKWIDYSLKNFGKKATDFRSHPGDLGMNAIAEKAVEQAVSLIEHNVDAFYSYKPEALSVNGADSINTVSGTAKYTAQAIPSDADTTVKWSVDDTNIATINDDGVLSAVNNGTVTVTAKFAYDESITASKEVKISGQEPAYTVSYAAGTDDDVAGLPEPFEFAKGTYVLSDKIPTRAGYKFRGWSKTPDGETVSSIDVAENITVYAVWELAYRWTFEKDGDLEGISIGGFNITVAGGLANSISYESGLTVGCTSTKLDSNVYDTLLFKALITSEEKDQTYSLTVTTDVGVYTYEKSIPDGNMNTYIFDISDAEGTITSFMIAPSMLSCSISVDEICFSNSSGVYERVIDGNGTINNIPVLSVAANQSVKLTNGVFVIGEIEGTPNIFGTPDANIIIHGENKPSGYTEIALDGKTADGHIRYVCYGGDTSVLGEYEDMLGIIQASPAVITVIEKEKADDVTPINSVCYYADGNGNALRIEDYDNGFSMLPGSSIRIKGASGIRFCADIDVQAKASQNYPVAEYGFIVGRADKLKGKTLNFDLDSGDYVYGAAYVAGSTDVIYDFSDQKIVFAGVLCDIPLKYSDTKLVVRPYYKVTAENKSFIVYGETVTESLYDAALAVKKAGGYAYEQNKAYIDEIIASVQSEENEKFIDMTPLLG